MKSRIIFISLILIFLATYLVVMWLNSESRFILNNELNKQPSTVALPVTSPFLIALNSQRVLFESGSENESSDPYWWLDSGGLMYFNLNEGKTIQGSLPKNSEWRIKYGNKNQVDTDNGYHPQNIFRLVSRNKWHNFRQEVYFMINKDELSDSSNRNESNGLLLFNRYVDSNNLYYTGIRVDGAAVIKKKINGIYYTLDYKPVISGKYDRVSNPNLLPKKEWIGVRSEIITDDFGVVEIRLYTDIGRKGEWTLVATAKDDGQNNGSTIDSSAFVGIRTDFMDIAFIDYKVENVGILKLN